MKVNNIDRSIVNEGEPVLYYLEDGSKHRFIREKLQIVPPGTKLPPEDSLCHFDFFTTQLRRIEKNKLCNRTVLTMTYLNQNYMYKNKMTSHPGSLCLLDQRHMDTYDYYLQ